jgi:hypothetical protein
MSSYTELLDSLEDRDPQVAKALRRAHENRKSRLEILNTGVRLEGLEEFLRWMNCASELYASTDTLEKITFLVERAKADFEVALETTLSGMHMVAYDSMRDVMEIEFLLRDFRFDSDRIEMWLTADSDTLFREFRAAELRKRHARRLDVDPRDLEDSRDYRGHSKHLHVSPFHGPFGNSRGISEDDPFEDGPVSFARADSCFWEIFEHARRTFKAVYFLAEEHSERASERLAPEDYFDEFITAHTMTQENQEFMLDKLRQAVHESEDDE